MNELVIFDLQRFALHDGPGIRTTVFLKGCPLDCVWCHNPESKSRKSQLGFLEKKCTLCGRCESVCSNHVHTVREGIHSIDFEQCVLCGECVKACLSQSLKIFGQRITGDAIMETVMKDWDYYERSGGGLTISGGEPMMQFEPLKNFLRLSKEKGLHVCLDTCGQAPTKNYLEIAPYVDIFLFDYKMTDADNHKRYTGTDNQLILKNLDALCNAGSDIYLRCPIVPGINMNNQHYRGISLLSKKYPQIKQVNLMPYHDMAKGKSGQIGKEYALSNLKTMDTQQIEAVYKKVDEFGCLNLKRG